MSPWRSLLLGHGFEMPYPKSYRTIPQRLDDIERLLRAPRCDECKWFASTAFEYGDCENPELLAEGSDDGCSLDVSPDFGCIQWEAKE